MASTTEHVATGSDLPERARSLQPLLEEQAAAADAQGRLTEPTVEALHREGMYTIWVPKELGGAELDPVSSLEVIENLTYGDPSVGWVVMATALSVGTAGGYLGDEAVDELFADGKYPMVAGQGTRPGVAVPKDDGFLVSGNWSFASGLLHGTHIHTLAIIEGTGEPRIFVVPVEKAKLLGNWDVMGLRGTGSVDYSIDNAFVPDAYSHFAVLDTGKRGGSLYNLGIIGFACICHTGWALGIGRRVLDELIGMIHEKAGRPGAQGESESFLEDLGKQEGAYRAGRALAYEAWNDVRDTLDRGERLSVRQHTLIRLAMTHCTWVAHDAAEFAYHRGGTTALRDGRMQHLFRDTHAGTQHLVASPPVWRNVGAELAGLAPGKHWVFAELVEN
jgi:alkylation response protein AidB-like acyl-CoA dehydrogenase